MCHHFKAGYLHQVTAPVSLVWLFKMIETNLLRKLCKVDKQLTKESWGFSFSIHWGSILWSCSIVAILWLFWLERTDQTLDSRIWTKVLLSRCMQNISLAIWNKELAGSLELQCLSCRGVGQNSVAFLLLANYCVLVLAAFILWCLFAASFFCNLVFCI